MAIKTITIKNLMEEINKLGFSKEDQVLLFADEKMVTIKKLFPQSHPFRDFASPIWEEAKKDNLTPQDIDEIIHQVRKAEKS